VPDADAGCWQALPIDKFYVECVGIEDLHARELVLGSLKRGDRRLDSLSANID
jgi:hypothetical protein